MNAMSQDLLQSIRDQFEIDPDDADLFVRAMTHRSFANEQELDYDNERLEFLGDAVIDLIVCEHLFLEYRDRLEGELSEIKSAVVNTESLTKISRELELAENLRLSKGEERVQRGRDKVIADTLEAFVGALFVSEGLERTRERMLPHFRREIERFIREGTRNYKGKLLEWTQDRGIAQPEYRVDEVEGPQHRPNHTVSVIVNGDRMGSGEGRTKKDAEQEAAREALEKLNAGTST